MELNFWQRVDNLLIANNLTRKELAAKAKFDVSNINKGIKDNNIPSAETAVKIAQFLHTDVEYLVTGTVSSMPPEFASDLDMLYKHHATLINLEAIPYDEQGPIESMINEIGAKYTAPKK